MKQNSFLLIILFSGSLLAPKSWALGKLGHQLVCQLSYQLLSDDKKFQVDELLSLLPRNDKQAINKYLRQKSDSQITFANSCVWADAIKRHDDYKQFKSWHYLNVTRDTKVITHPSCEKNCITQAINYHKERLVAEENKEKRSHALMFLGHWVGDIHQPLHVSYTSDLGGNRTNITSPVGKCDNLHWYWDECLLYPLAKGSKKNRSYDYVNHKQQLYRQLNKALDKALLEDWRNSSVDDWANESLSIIRGDAFNYCKLENDTCLTKTHTSIQIDEKYHQKFQTILHQRILQAAVRLAYLIESSLKQKTSD